jgi:signal transduction histidine kinase/phage shock protein PspC (stress-responsive transcriptional regulator)
VRTPGVDHPPFHPPPARPAGQGRPGTRRRRARRWPVVTLALVAATVAVLSGIVGLFGVTLVATAAAALTGTAAYAIGPDPDRTGRPALFSRSAGNSVIGGVAGGLAERIGLEPMLVRLGFVVLAIGGGVGAVLYLVCWSLADDVAAPGTRPPGRGHPQARLRLLVLAAVVLAAGAAAAVMLGNADGVLLAWRMLGLGCVLGAGFGVARELARGPLATALGEPDPSGAPGAGGPPRWRPGRLALLAALALLGLVVLYVSWDWMLAAEPIDPAVDPYGTGEATGIGRTVQDLFLAVFLSVTVGAAAALLLPLRPAPVARAPGSTWATAVPPAPADQGEARRRVALGRVAALLIVVAGGLPLLRSTGLWFSDQLAWLVALGALGSAVVLSLAPTRRSRPATGQAAATRPRPWWAVLLVPARAVLGLGLAYPGVAMFAGSGDVAVTGQVLAGMAGAAAGVSLVFGPWVLQLARQLGTERRSRIRSEERAELAAHLHDSVLHTLALLQRGDVPRELVNLARSQERELRAWLNGEPSTRDEPGSLRAAVHAIATRVEQLHAITVEVVVVGDAPLDDRVNAVVQACQEAVVNAARHSGAPSVSVYVEVEPDQINGFVRDRGRGFDPAAVPQGRRGLAASIHGRVRRHGGRAVVASRPGQGTEVHVQVPFDKQAAGAGARSGK